MISYDASCVADVERYAEEYALPALRLLATGSGMGGEYTQWFSMPEYSGIAEEAKRINEMSELLVVVGTGGSYLGARAMTELLLPEFSPRRVIFAGKDISARRMAGLLGYLKDKEFSVNVVSKSGSTTEPAAAFRFMLDLLENKYGTEAGDRITVTTDAEKGPLLAMSRERGWRRFVIPDGVGGRYSVLSPAGLLPIAVAGIDTEALIRGASIEKKRMLDLEGRSPELLYAASRRLMFSMGFRTELLSFWEPSMRGIGEWYKQLFGESEGKNGRGIFPATLEMTADLHSMGQYIQQGPRDLFETMLSVSSGAPRTLIPSRPDDADGFEYLAGKELDEIEKKTRNAVTLAHMDGGVPVTQVSMEELNAENAGALIWFFEAACAVSAYMDGVNPFDQPGVEAYKANMHRLLGKPGF